MTRLSELGELGLLGRARAPRADRRHRERRGRSSTAAWSSPRTRSSRACTSGSTGSRWRELGFRAAAVNISDLAASGAEPEALVVTLALPPDDTTLDDVLELYEGIARGRRARRRRRHDRVADA